MRDFTNCSYVEPAWQFHFFFGGAVINNTEEVFLSKNLEKVCSENIFHCILPFTLCKILLDLGTESLTSAQKYQAS